MNQPKLILAEDWKRAVRRTGALIEPIVKDVGDGGGAVGMSEGAYDFVISTASVDRYGDVILQDGWQLQNYANNPVVLFGHDYCGLPIGTSKASVIDGVLHGTQTKFADHELAQDVKGLIDQKVLRGASIGARPLEWKFNAERGDWAVDYLKMELLEWSVVPIPANPEALLVASKSLGGLKAYRSWTEEALDGRSVGVGRSELETVRKHLVAKQFQSAGVPVQRADNSDEMDPGDAACLAAIQTLQADVTALKGAVADVQATLAQLVEAISADDDEDAAEGEQDGAEKSARELDPKSIAEAVQKALDDALTTRLAALTGRIAP